MSVIETIEAIRSGLICVGLSALAAIAVGIVGTWLYRGVASAMRRPLSVARITAFLAVSAFCVIRVGAKFLMPPPSTGGTPVAPVVVMPEEIAQGWRLESVTTNDAVSYAMPEGVSPSFNWHKRGTSGEWARLDLGDFAFPLGTNGGVVTSLSVFNDGRIRPTPRDAAREICAVGVPMLAMQGASSFWVAEAARSVIAPYHGKVLTWENFFLNADTNTPVNAQIELVANGDFVTRSNDVQRIHRRIEPFDWDGDGLENTVDPEPLVAGADAHGTNAEWYNVVCSNVLEAVGGDGSAGTPRPTLSWLDGANTNAYYFVDVVTTNGLAPIYFTGDHESRLGNPVVVARGGETNHVPLLIGINYAVTSPVPFMVSIPDDGFASVTTNGVSNYEVQWPLNFEFTESIGESNRVYSVSVEPYDPGGELTWEPPHRGVTCGCLSFSGWSIVFGYSPTCDCGGNCPKGILYYLLGGAVFAATGGVCRYGFDDPAPPDPISYDPTDVPSLSITFSKQAVVFDDECEIGMYDVKPKSSTRVRISVDAYGGTRGGELVFSSLNLGKLTPVDGSVTLPPSRTLAEQEAFHTTGVYEGAEASDAEGDVSISGTFTELVTGQQISDSNSLTVVRVEIKEVKMAPGNPYVHRRCYGIAEEVECKQFPSAPAVLWRTNGNGTFSLGITKIFCCPLTAERCQLYAECKSAPLPIILRVIEPERIGCDYAEFLPPTSDGKGCGMLLYLQLLPLSVSFSGLEIQEIPADLTNWQQWGSHSGYFDDYAFYQRWCHTTLWGAGVWHAVNEFNGIEFDESRIWTWPQPWSEGTLSWTIPYGWRLAGSTFNAPVGQINPPSYSVWTMSSNFIEKTKHSHTIGVSANGQMYLDGSLRNGNP